MNKDEVRKSVFLELATDPKKKTEIIIIKRKKKRIIFVSTNKKNFKVNEKAKKNSTRRNVRTHLNDFISALS